uniref:glucuronosyltransferase n=1 Tax=Plectus sambesii TaxID=2011161 RepID=A0A914UIJ9_9BILA
MSLKAVLIVSIVFFLDSTNSFKVLIYSPTIGHSHNNFMGQIADSLLDAGHEVLVYVPVWDPDVQTNGTKRAPVLRVDVLDGPSLLKNLPHKSDPFNEEVKAVDDNSMQVFMETFSMICEGQVSNKAIMKTLREHHFDVAIAEFFDHCPFGIFKLLGIPANIVASAVSMSEVTGDLFGVPLPLSYVPSLFGSSTDEMSYQERAMNIMMSGIWRGIVNGLLDRENDIFRRYYGSDFPALDDLAKKTALAFINADEFFELPRPITHRIVYVGGIGIPEAKNLSNEVTKIVEASDKGVILLSFGSVANSTLLPMEKKLAILRTMANFPKYTFIWKYEQPENDIELFKNYPNVYPMKWLPQVDLLNHPKVKVFITHGGLNSVTEAITSGTPTVAIPLFADQEHNVAVAVKRGVSAFVSKRNLNTESLTAALQEVLQNEKHELNAKRLAQMIAKKPIKPKDLIVKWTEFVAEFQDLSNLDIAGQSFKILIFSPTIGHSHCNFLGKIADTLLDAGHEVLVYVPVLDPDVQTNGTKRAPVLRVDVLDDPSIMKKHPLKLDPFNENFDFLGEDSMKILIEVYFQTCTGQVSNKVLMNTLRDRHFDIAITELHDYCPFGIFKLLGIPASIVASALPMTETIGDLFGVPQPLSYVPDIFESSSDEMNYKERAMNIITSGKFRGLLNRMLDKENEIFRRYYGSDFPALDDLAKKTSLAFVNANEFFELPRPITHRIVYIGGIGVPKVKNLSSELTKVVEASDKGVILLSFGSFVSSTLLPLEKKLGILRMMANFPQYTFIWKYERPEDDVELFANYSNVYPMKWVPQVDLLNHPKVKAFITHGGMNSLMEAITSTTPTVAIPLFADQEHNVAVAVKRGVSTFVSKRNIDTESLTAALQEVLQNEK